MKHSLRTRVVLSSAAALALVGGLTACGGSGDDSPPPQAPPKASENQINVQSRDSLQDGGKLTWPLSGFPANFNTLQLDGNDLDTSHVMEAILPKAFYTDAAGKPFFNKDLLASDPTLKSDPKQVITYKINPKAAWYDGTPITWEDFQSLWKATNGADKAYTIVSSNGYEQIESVEKGADEREVVVTYKNKYADWQAVFDPIYPKSTTSDPKVFNEGWKAQPLTSAGPFKLGSVDQTAKTITLVRNEKWWGNPAKLESIVYRVIPPDAQIDALANGEIDLMDIGPDVNKYQRAKGVSAAEIRVAGGPNFRHLTINGTSPVLQDVKVRQALAMGIDRTAIGKALLGPMNIDPKPLNNHIFMTNQDGYKDNSGDVGKYNPEKAKSMLDEAGWKVEGNVRKKDGKALEINFVIPTGVATSKQESELIQNMLAQIGVTVKLNAIPVDDLFDKYVTPGQFDFTVFSWIGTAYPISSAKSIYKNPVKGADGNLVTEQNYARVGSPEIDALFDQATAELDRTKAIDIANRIDAKIWEEVHSLTTYQRPDQWACKKGLANFGAFGFADTIYEDIGWVKA
jgi:peptide/nickel transport system substrate-binding protein